MDKNFKAHLTTPPRTRPLWAPAAFIALVFVVSVAGVLAYWYFHDVVPYRVPPAWDETCYINGTLNAMEAVSTSVVSFARLFVDAGACTSHNTFVGTWFSLPLLFVRGVRCEVFFLASVVMTAVAALCLGWGTFLAAGRDPSALLGGAIAGWYFLLAPMTLGCAAIYYSEAPLAVAFSVSVVAYLIARQRDKLFVWMVASVVLMTCLYVRAERGLPVIAMIMAAYCTDECVQRGWRAGHDAVLTMLGLSMISLLGLQTVIPKWDATSPMSLLANMMGVILVVYAAAHWVRPSQATRRALAYALPVWVLLNGWFIVGSNASHFFATLDMFMGRDAQAPRLFSYPFIERFVNRFSGTPTGGYLKLVLCAGGLLSACWYWPGLITMALISVLSTAKLNVGVGARYLYQFHLIAALAAGILATTVCRWLLRRLRAPRIWKWLLAGAGISVVFVISQFVGLLNLARKTFEGQDCTYWIMFDRQRVYWDILAQARDHIPRRSSLAHFPALHALENGAVRLYGRLHRLDWWTVDLTMIDDRVVPWNERERAQGIMPDYVLVSELTTRALYSNVASASRVAKARELLTRDAEYTLQLARALTNNAGTVYVFNRTKQGEQR
ncbi:MAG: hypothetical protein N2595_02820 [bacterium]|nr:hypothetical protein [bacterium]